MGHARRVICAASVWIGLTGARIEFSCVGLRGGLGVPPIAWCWGLADVMCLEFVFSCGCRVLVFALLRWKYCVCVVVKVLLRAPQSADVTRVL